MIAGSIPSGAKMLFIHFEMERYRFHKDSNQKMFYVGIISNRYFFNILIQIFIKVSILQ